MAVEVIDQIARDEIDQHETANDPHAGQYMSTTGETVFQVIRLASATKVWELTIDDNGIPKFTEVTP